MGLDLFTKIMKYWENCLDYSNDNGDGKKLTNLRHNLGVQQSWSIDELNIRDIYEEKGGMGKLVNFFGLRRLNTRTILWYITRQVPRC